MTETWKIERPFINIQFTLYYNCINEHEQITPPVQGKIVAVVVAVVVAVTPQSEKATLAVLLAVLYSSRIVIYLLG